MINEDCKNCKYYDESLEIPCTLEKTEIRCNILKAYVRKMKFKKMVNS